MTGTTANYEYDAFKETDASANMGNGLYDFLKKTQNVSTPKSQTSYQAAFGAASSKAGAGGGDGSAYAYSRAGSNMNRSTKRAFSQDKDFIHNTQTFHHKPNNDLRTQSYNNFMTLSPTDAEKSDKLKDLLDFNSMKTDKHMRDTEAFLASRHYEPAEKFSNSMTMRGRFNTDKRPYKAKTKLDVNNDFLAEGEGTIPEMFKRPVEDFSENCDAHYKYGLLQIEKDMKARGSAFSAAENRLLQ